MISDRILEAISKASGVKKEEIVLESPENNAFGDYSSNIALGGENPRQKAKELSVKLKADGELAGLVDKIEVAGAGFINFWLKKEVLLQNLAEIVKEKDKYGGSSVGKGKTVVIDYSSPNIAKPFGIGHLRSTIIGQALYNLYKALGFMVIGDNHLGDWGTQFGKLIYMVKKENVKDFSLDKLEELYTEFHKLTEDPKNALEMESGARAWFKKLEDGDSEAKDIWQKCVDVSLNEFDRIYKILGVKIDFAFGESYYESEMKQLMDDPEVKKHLDNGEEGATVINLDSMGVKVPLMFLKGDGATTYATRDLATIKFRVRKWDPDIFIYEVGAEQTLHFQQVFAAARLLKLVKDSVVLYHTAHGLYLAPDGRKFSTRKGKTIKLEEVLDEAVERAKKLGNDSEKVASEVGIGAIKYFDLMHSVSSNVVFDWEKMMNLEGNSGPYLQYTIARTNSVLSKAHLKGFDQTKIPLNKGETLQVVPDLNNNELWVLRSLVRFPAAIYQAASVYSPNILCNYLFDLAQKFNAFYNGNRIIDSDNEEFRLLLTSAVGQVLKNGLGILGIETPEKM